MKKLLLSIATVALCVAGANAFPKALYVKKGEEVTKYNFGVAGDLIFSNNGQTLSISGYEQTINLNDVDYISFSAITGDNLTPTAQKTKLVEVGDELNSYIDLNKLSDLLNMWHMFFDHHENAQGVWICPPCEYEVPEEYWNVHKKTKSLLSDLGKMAKGDFSVTRAIANDALDLYKAQDYFGIYTADEENKVWKKTAASEDCLEIRFNSNDNSKYFVKLVNNYGGRSWTTNDFEVIIPTELVITFGQGDKEFATMTINTDLIQDEFISMETRFVAGGYNVINVLKITNDDITNHAEVYTNDYATQLVNANSTVEGRNLLNYDIMYNDIKEATHYHDENGDCQGENPDLLVAHFNKAYATADVMGNLQANAKLFKIEDLYNILKKEQDNYYFIKDGYEVDSRGKIVSYQNNILTLIYDPKEWYDSLANHLNTYSDANFAYDKTGKIQGYFNWEIDEDYYSYYPYYGDYEEKYGYVIIDDYVVSCSNLLFDEDGNWMGYGEDFYYSGHKEDDYNWEQKRFKVAKEDVIFPEQIKELEYEIMPILTFPDLTNYAIEDFFDETSFSKLIDDYNDIIDTYFKVTGQDYEDEYENGYNPGYGY